MFRRSPASAGRRRKRVSGWRKDEEAQGRAGVSDREHAGRSGRHDRRRRPSRRRQEEGGGRPIRSKGSGHQEQAAAERPGVQPGRPPTAPRRTAEAQHAASVRAQAARPSAAPCQARRPAGRGVWERRAWRAACSSSRTRHDKPVATGENACTREQRSGGPVTARSGGTTDHAAERNAGSGQAGSVTERSDGASPCGTRTAWSGAGPGRTSPTTPEPGITQREPRSGERGDLPPHARRIPGQ